MEVEREGGGKEEGGCGEGGWVSGGFFGLEDNGAEN